MKGHPPQCRYILTLLLSALALPALTAESIDTELEAILGGFEEEALQGFDTPPAAPKRDWRISGRLLSSGSYNFAHPAPDTSEVDHRGLSRLRLKLNLELDWDWSPDWRLHAAGYAFHDFAYAWNGRDGYPDTLLDSMEQEVELGELWLHGRLTPALDLKVGRQIVVWGKSDNLRVTDVINPMDQREPGWVDIEDLRLPLTMARMDYYRGDWSLTTLVIQEQRLNKQPAVGSNFYPFSRTQPNEERPKDAELALALNGVFSGWDLALYAARLNDDTPYIITENNTTLRQHSRITLLGSTINIARGNWLLKGELAHFRGLLHSATPYRQRRRSDLLLGVEYSGIRDVNLSFELLDRHLHSYDSALLSDGIERDELQAAFRYQGDYRHDRLHLTLFHTLSGGSGNGGGFTRLSTAYDLQDALTLTGGLVLYHSGDNPPFNAIGDTDRLFLDLKYSF